MRARKGCAPIVLLSRATSTDIVMPKTYVCPCPVHPDSKPYTDGRCAACARAYRIASYDKRGSSDNDRYLSFRGSAARRGISFRLTFNEWYTIVSQPCAYANGWTKDIRSGVDRKNSSLGYTVENCLPCCARHNLFKSDVLNELQTKDAVLRYGIVCENTKGGRTKGIRKLEAL